MQEIGDEIQDAIGALRLAEKKAEVLDICMAPGGYSASALKYSPHAHVTGITLPSYLGGHKVHIPYGPRDPRVSVHFTNITMLAAEFGALDIPEDHPDISNLSTKRPWATNSFDGVFCDGQVSRTHAPHIKSYLEQHKAGRLMCSQLILEMQRIKPGGTFVMLLHRVENWRTMKLLSINSFYLIAKNVQPHQPEALIAINEWKAAWKNATFPLVADEGDQKRPEFIDEHVQHDEVSSFLRALVNG